MAAAGSPVANPVCMVRRMTSLGLPRRAASANGSEDRMSAIVARTASIGWFSCRMPAVSHRVGHQAARVTHTLLFPAAAAMARTSATTALPGFHRVDCRPAAWATSPRAVAHGLQSPRPPSPQPTAAARTSVRSHACRRADHPPTACRHAAWPMQATAFHTRSVGLNANSRVGDARGLTAGRLEQLPYKPNAVRRGVRPGQSRVQRDSPAASRPVGLNNCRTSPTP